MEGSRKALGVVGKITLVAVNSGAIANRVKEAQVEEGLYKEL